MKSSLITIKRKHLEYLKEQLAKCNGDVNAKLYLNSCIKQIESDLVPKRDKPNFETISCDKAKIPYIEKFGFENDEAVLIATLISTKRGIQAGEFAIYLEMDRGRCYRTLEKLVKMNVIIKTDIEVAQYYLVNKENPLQPMIEQKEQELNKLKSLTLEIKN